MISFLQVFCLNYEHILHFLSVWVQVLPLYSYSMWWSYSSNTVKNTSYGCPHCIWCPQMDYIYVFILQQKPCLKPTYNNKQTLCFTCFNRWVFGQQQEKGKTQNWKAANIPIFNLYLPLFSVNKLYSSAMARIWCRSTSLAYLYRMYWKSLYWYCTQHSW